MRARTSAFTERVVRALLWFCAFLAVLVSVGIVLSLIIETARFFALIPADQFFFGLHWSPQLALRPDQVAGSGQFGAVPLFAGTVMIMAIAMAVAMPGGLLIAMFLSEYARSTTRAVVKPFLEILAGVPTVVYGYMAVLVVAPFIKETGESLGLAASSESALAAGLVMGVMILPFISSLADDVFCAVPQAQREGALALGLTKAETIFGAVLPAAMPGLFAAALLAVSRALGETMIVVMAAGLTARLTANPFDSVTTVTVQIASLLVGDQSFDDPKSLAAFALGFTLFAVTLALNLFAIRLLSRARRHA